MDDNPPVPLEGLHETRPPPFLTKTYEIVDDSNTNHIVSWSKDNNSFIVWEPQTFALTLLPKYFKHNNFSSFVRQLNTYGFKKVDPDRWEFANVDFLKGQRHLFKNITRTRTHHQSLESCIEVGRFGIDGEINRLRRDKQVLMIELAKLRHQQQNTKACLQLVEEKLGRAETKQQQMMSFLAKAMKRPELFHRLTREDGRKREIEEAVRKKRMRSIDQGYCNVLEDEATALFVKVEPEEFGDVGGFGGIDLERLSMEMKELGDGDLHRGEEGIEEGFLEDLFLNDRGEEDDDGNVDVLMEQFGAIWSFE